MRNQIKWASSFSHYLSTVLLIILFASTAVGQTPYYQIDGNNCDQFGNSPEWGPPNIPDPAGDSSAGGSDMVGYWTHYDEATRMLCFAYQRISNAANGPTASYVAFLNTDCDLATGYDYAHGEGADIAIGFEWRTNGPWEALLWEYGINGSTPIAPAYVGEGDCGDPATSDYFAEFCVSIDDLIGNNLYDPCGCNTISAPGIVTLAGGSLNSEPKDFMENPLSVDMGDINNVPTADFQGPEFLCLNVSGSYTGTLSVDPDGDNLTYCIDVDYGGGALICDYTTPTANISFDTPGEHNVALEVTDPFGCTELEIIPVFVAQEPVADIDIDLDICNRTVTILGSGSTDYTLNDNLTYDWEFSSGDMASFEDGSYTFPTCRDYSITLTVTDPDATPPCNVATTIETVSFDPAPPSITCPPTTRVCAIEDAPVLTFAQFTAGGGSIIDNCTIDSNSFDLSNQTTNNGSCPETITRTYYIEDECANFAVCQHMIVLEDLIPPVITGVSDEIVECDGAGNQSELQAWIGANAGASATDNCSEVIWSSSIENVQAECGESEVYTVNFIATDACGLVSSESATFTIEDTSDPAITINATDEVVECDGNGNNTELQAWLNSNGGTAATDLCSTVTWENEVTDFNEQCGETGEISVTFTAIDDCGRTTTSSATFIIVDTTPPAVTDASDEIVECNGSGNTVQLQAWLDNHGGATVSDNCSDITWSDNFTSFNQECGETGAVTVVFTATDECGLSSTSQATFTIEDTTPAAVVDAQDLTVECDGNGNTTQLNDWLDSNGVATANDICSEITWSSDFNSLSDQCAATGEASVIFTVTDECGLTATTRATFIIEDTTPPAFTDAKDETVECDGAGNQAQLQAWLNDNGGATASDICGDINWTNNFTDLSNLCGANGSALVIFTATDECGLSSTTSATFTIEDNTSPVVTDASDETVECDGAGNQDLLQAWLDDNGGATATDDCSDLTWTNDFIRLDKECGKTGSVTVTFTATDDCGLATSTQATFTIEDTTPAAVIDATDLTVECDGSGNIAQLNDWINSNGVATANEICSEITWTSNFTALSNECAATGEASVIFTVTDECGLFTTTMATFTIEDTTPPEITVNAADGNVECDGLGNTAELQAWLANNGGATANDNCGDVTWTNNFSDLSDLCAETGTATIVFTATDECGLSSTTEATFTITDTTAPSITAAMDETVECDGAGNQALLQAWLDNNGGATSSDICGAISWDNDFTELIKDCGETGDVTVIFTATDECGLSSTSSATFTIEDTTPAAVVDAENITVECDGSGNIDQINNWINSNGVAAADEICSEITWTSNYTTLSDECGATGDATVIFTVTDECGLFSTTMATFTIEDTTPPAVVDAIDETVECDGAGNTADLQAWLNNNGGATATDACSDVTWTNDFTALSDDCGETGSALVIFTATDDCGLATTTQATFTIEDTTPPAVIDAVDETVECDGAGNIAALQAWLDNNGGATATDDCSDITWTNDFTALSDDCGETGSALVIFTATDDCGLATTTQATFTIQDTTPPVVTDAVNETVECDGTGNTAALQAWLDNNGGATATDDCSDITWTNDFIALSDDCGATGSALVIFTATDDCGLATTTQATFTIEDTTAPVVTEAIDETVECDGAGNTAALQAWLDNNGGATATDDCSDVTWSNDFTALSDDCGETGTALVIFTATDDCGLATTTEATFTIQDITPPAVIDAIDETVECDGAGNTAALQAWLDNNGGATATDDCSDVTWSNDFTALSDDCGETGSALVIFTARDDCGLATTTEATFTIQDTTPPAVIDAVDETVECDGSGNTAPLQAWLDNNGGATATDDCSDLTWTNDFTALSDDCGETGSALVIFTATDDCGLATTTEATFTIQDTTPPAVIDAVDETVECDGAGNIAALQAWLDNNGGATATDDCSDITWTNDFTALSDDCGETGSALVIFTATDDCGLATTTQATFTIEDTTAPVVTEAIDETVECDGTGNTAALQTWLDNNGGATATDDCSDITWTNDFIALSDDCGVTGSALVIFTATDDCGLATTTQAIFTIQDTTPPAVIDAVDETVECDGAGNTAALQAWLDNNGGATATDDCSDVTWSNDFTALSDDCGETGTALVIFTATDDCGLATTTQATFTIQDITPPAVIDAIDETVECDGAGNTAALQAWLDNNGGATATDDCSDVTWSNDFTALSDDCGETGSALVIFTATDDCGLATTTEATFTIQDTTPPAVIDAIDETVECDGAGNTAALQAWLENNGGATATDDCSDVTWTNDFTALSDDCGETGTALVIFTATDDCGLATTTEATFTIQDTTPPAVIDAVDETVECDGTGNTAALQAWLDNNGGATATDDCSDITWTNDFTALSDDCGETGSALVIFTATDDCGLATTTEATFTIQDTTPPAVIDAVDETVECDGTGNTAVLQTWLDNNGGATATDDCSDITWSNDFTALSDDCGETGTALVIFTATDDCGLATTTQATFTIQDTTPPVVTDAVNETVECDGAGNTAALQAWLDNNGGATATDDCSDVTWTNDFTALSDDCGETGTALVIFTATDDCGLATTTEATFTIQDTTPPAVIDAVDETVECDGAGNTAVLQAWLDNNGGATATDDCSDVTWTNDFTALSDDCGETGTALVIFTATDDCGLATTTQATFTIQDTTPPVVTDAVNETVECDGTGNTAPLQAWLDNNGGATATDDCSDVTWTNNFTALSDDCGETGSALVIFTATDDCGLATTTQATFTIEDTTPPAVIDAVDETVECDGAGTIAALQAWLDNNGGATATDDCSDITWTNDFTALSDDCGETGSALVIFTATDDCGLATTTQATFTIEDTTPPVVTEAIDETVECDGTGNTAALQTWLDNNGGATATDDCSDITWTNDFIALSDDCGATGSALVIFTATDDCGLATTTQATFTIEDTTPPAVIDAVDETVECDGAGNTAALQAWLDNNGGATATDDCSDITWTNDFTALSDDCGETGTALVIFTATDDCGLATTTEATFTIQDTTPPAVIDAVDETVECDGAGNIAALQAWLDNNGGATATDDCSDITWTNDFTALSDDCGETGSALVIFTATDDCGLATTTEATFTIQDTTPPAVIDAVDETVECDGAGNIAALQAWLDNNGGATATDDCSDITWTNDFTALSDDCGETGSALVIFTATDDCGLATTTEATFTIQDTTPPAVIDAVDETVECDGTGNTAALQAWLDNNGGATATDDCSDITWTNDFTALSDDCGETGSALVIFTATDDCGLATTTEATFTIQDTTPPAVIDAVDETVECDGTGNTAVLQAWLDNNGGATATDDCSDITWTNDFIALSDDCGATGSALVIFTATDDCGLATTTQATFTIEDTTPPAVIDAVDETVECDGTGNTAPLQAWLDNNGGATATDDCSDVTWSNDFTALSDDCGETGSALVIFTATDDCGLATTTQATFTIQDITPPAVIDAIDETVECDGAGNTAALQAWLDNNGEATATDDCSDVTWTNDFTALSDDCGETGSALVIFTATDECGLATTTQATFTIQDTTPPAVIDAIDETVECDGTGNTAALQAWLDNNGGATATDDCSDVTWTNDFTALFDDCGATGSALVIFTATDDCGLATTTEATFTIQDTTPPAVIDAVDETVECDGAGNIAALQTWLDNNGGATATDECSDVTWTHNFTEVIGDCAGISETPVIFTATDDCGLSSTTEATFTIEDTQNPITTIPEDITVDCSNIPAEDSTLVVATDICNNLVVAYLGEVNNFNDNCPYTIERTWTITDNCGEVATIVQVITVEDTEGPILTIPEDLTIDCNSIPAEDPALGTATDNCSTPIVEYLGEEVINPNPCGYTIERSWKATDQCGAEVIEVQTIEVLPSDEAYFIDSPNDTTYTCQELTQITSLDVSNGMSLSCEISGTVQGEENYSECSTELTRTWMYEDVCGRTISHIQVIQIVNDTISCNDGNPCTSEDIEVLDCLGNICVPCQGIDTPTENPTPNPVAPICEGSTADLSVTGCDGILVWYADNTTDVILYEGDIFTTPTLDVTTSYFVACNIIECFSERIEISVTVNPLPQPEIVGDAVICDGGSTLLQLTENYSEYLWSDNSTGPELEARVTGSYSVTVTDENGCIAEASFDLLTNENPEVAIVGELGFCNGGSTLLQADAGFIDYNWSNNETTSDITVSEAGTYAVTVIDNNGCSATNEVTVEEYEIPMVDIDGLADVCPGDSTMINVVSTDALEYLWSSGDTTAAITVPAGTYVVTITDMNGCTNQASHVITEFDPIIFEITGTDFCVGNISTLETNRTFGEYLWNDNSTEDIINVTEPGTYSVTVTDINGCTATDEITINNYPEPTVDLIGPSSICFGATADLTLDQTFDEYLWSNGSTGNTTQIDAEGTYRVTVTDENGCQATDSISIAIQEALLPTILGTDFCEGTSTTLSVGDYTTYQWSTGETTAEITVTEPGDYSVVISDENGCSGTDDISIIMFPTPELEITGDLFFCFGESTELDAGAGFTYEWSNGETTQNLTVDTEGTYAVTITDDNGCVNNTSVAVVQIEELIPNITGSDFCDGNATTISVDPFDQYLWSNGETTQDISVTEPGTYSVIVTDTNGCTATDEVAVDTFPSPSTMILGSNTFCEGATTDLMVADAFDQYTWSNGETTQSITIGTDGTYGVTITDANGCTFSTDFTVQYAENLEPVILGTDFCEGTSTTLSVGDYATYEWSTGETTPEITVTEPGDYSVIVFDQDGCTGADDISIIMFPTPELEITGDLFFCFGESTELDAGAGFTYEWANGETTQNLTVDTEGTYAVTITDDNGCVNNTSVAVVQIEELIPNITGSDFCDGNATTISVDPFDQYLWSNGETTQDISVTEPGTYSVIVTDTNGCTATDEVAVDTFPSPMTMILGSNTFCEGATTDLMVADIFDQYSWSNGETTQTITITTDGTYGVTITDTNGCTFSTDFTVQYAANLEPVILGNDFCEGTSTTLSVGDYATYEWSTGETTPEITVTEPGDFSVDVSDQDGCSGSDDITITMFPTPELEITGDLFFCFGESTELDAGTGFTYEWANGETTQNLTVDTEGTYAVTITDDNGCVNNTSVDVVQIEELIPNITGGDFCVGNATTISVDPYDQYLWSNGETTQDISVTEPGTYSVIVTDTNGCTATDEVAVDTFPSPMTMILGSNTFCEGATTDLMVADIFDQYSWSNGETTQTITITTDGTYGVTITDTNGCTFSTDFTVQYAANLEPVILGNDFCEGTSTTLSVGDYATYEWSTGETTPEITVTEPGDFSVDVSDQDGCYGSDDITIIMFPKSELEITGDLFFCFGESTELDAGTGFTYEWANGETTQNLTVDTEGTYAVTITDDNGCVNNTSVAVVQIEELIPNITGGDFCVGNSTTISVDPFDQYLWSNGATTQDISVTEPGTYSVIVTDTNGCTATDEIAVDTFPSPMTMILGSNTFCESGSTELMVADIFDQYSWSNGETTQTITITTDGTYGVTITDTNGCTFSTDFTVQYAANLEPVILGNDFCEGTSTTLSVGDYATYEWSTGETTPEITVTEPGDYSVDVSDQDGCYGSDDITIIMFPTPELEITGDLFFCFGESTELDAGAGAGFTYEWANGETTQNLTVDTEGTYAVTITDDNGCVNNTSVAVVQIEELIPNITGGDFCVGNSTTISVDPFDQYLWSNGATTQDISVTEPGTYSVIVTDTNGCTATDEIAVDTFPSPMTMILGSNTFCESGSTELMVADIFDQYSWSNGETTQTITITTDGTYGVTITDTNGCTFSTDFTVLYAANLEPVILGTDFCEGTSTTLSVGDFATYLWSTGETTPEITVTEPGDFSVDVSDQDGCSGSDDITIIMFPTPELEITGDLFFCFGESTELDAGTGFTYEWANGETTQNLTVDTEGTYAVTITDDNGCVNNTSVVVVQEEELLPEIIGQDFCEGSTTILEIGSYGQYLWSNGETTETITIDTDGEYFVTVTDTKGCSGIDNISIGYLPNPEVTITGSIPFCAGTTNTLEASQASSYEWSNGETTQTINVDTDGTYSVTITDDQGCSSSTSFDFAYEEALSPEIIGEDFCEGTTTVLTVGDYDQYLWSNGETTQNLTIDSEGDYSVTVTDVLGCTGIANTSIGTLANPELNITGDPFFCFGQSTELDAGAGSTYLWSNGETNQTIIVDTEGTYAVTITDDKGCVANESIDVIQEEELLPEIIGQDFCEGSTTILEVGSYGQYLWSNGETTETITIDTDGEYFVTVTDTKGCSGIDNISIGYLPNPEVTITGSIPFCAGTTNTLEASQASSYEWSNGETTQTINVDTDGTYSVTITDDQGCSSSTSFDFAYEEALSPEIIGEDFCEGTTTVLAVGDYDQYLWSNGETTQNLTIDSEGDYSVTVTDVLGCTGIANTSIGTLANPELNITGDPFFCFGQSTELDAGAGSTYLWSNGETNQTIIVDTEGTYAVTITDDKGCVANESIDVVQEEELLPEIIGQDFCEGSTTILEVGVYDQYLWSTGETTETITIDTDGDYFVTVTNTKGCSGIDNISIGYLPNPEVTITGSVPFCAGTTNTLEASQASSYEWSNGETTQTINVDTDGTYSVTITDDEGCSNSTSVDISQEDSLTPEIIGDDFCEGTSTILTIGVFDQYLWSNGETTQDITVATDGVYSVTVTDVSGCTGIDDITIGLLPLPTVVITGPTTLCAGASTMLDAGAGFTYLWSTGETEQTITVDTGGTYEVTITDDKGCSNSNSIELTQEAALDPMLEHPDPCMDNPTLNAGDYDNYLWSDGSNLQTLKIETSGTYSVTVTDDKGCTGIATLDALISENLDLDIIGNRAICSGSATMISVSEDFESYLWSNSLTTQEIEVNTPGIYLVTVTDAAGCTGVEEIEIIELGTLLPQIQGDNICEGSSSILEVGSYDSYLWSDGTTESTLEVFEGGSYFVTVSDNNGCTGITLIDIDLINFMTPIATSQSYCSGETIPTLSVDHDKPENLVWSDTDGNVLVEGEDNFTPIENGTYFVQFMSDDGNCISEMIEISLTEIGHPELEIGPAAQLNCTNNNVTILGDVSNDVTELMWTNTDGDVISEMSSAEVTSPGWYFLMASNDAGCYIMDSVMVEQLESSPVSEILMDGTQVIDCYNDIIGLYTNEQLNVEYTWTTNGGTFHGLDLDLSAGGDVTLTAIDTITGCEDVSSITITENMATLELALSNPAPLDCEITSAELVATIDPSANFEIQWLDGDMIAINGANNNSYTTSEIGTYFVEVLNTDTGCKSIESVEVTSTAGLPTVGLNEYQTLACGIEEMPLNVKLENPENYTIIWSTNNGNISSDAQGDEIMITQAGTYRVEVHEEDNNCSTSFEIIVLPGETIDVATIVSNETECNDEESGSIIIAGTNGGQMPYTYTLNNEIVANSSVFDNLLAGEYNLNIKDANGCSMDTIVVVNQTNAFELTPTEEKFVKECRDDVQLSVETDLPEDEIASITWSPNSFLSCVDCLEPTMSADFNSVYVVELTDIYGCRQQTRVQVDVNFDAGIYMPNVIETEIRGEDLVFVQSGPKVEWVTEFFIMDRWGNRMFLAEDFLPNDNSIGWDGYYKGSKVVQGVYAWYVEYVVCGMTFTKYGDITILHGKE